ncbi:LysE family translocator [Trinickia terrae]|uniref:LysE family translocator n=1 Tax=Trinickia terrae TaxID=2571161 RepID=A0A4U1HXA3_9BURK|nr:LysE family translocator [Trinickia terrae]TKC86281.1 LysE family translocator [Trinickia terrae]
MIHTGLLSANVLVAYTTYLIGTASPGPSNLAIMSLAMRSGRKAAVTFALGVMSGSFFWATLATLGLSAVLTAYSGLLVAIKVAGGAYLLWLALKSAKSALTSNDKLGETAGPQPAQSAARLYTRGLLMHLTNPKAILVWLAIISIAFPVGAQARHTTLAVVAGCICIGVLVFCGYAILFSMPSARRIYLAIRRWLDATLAVAFGYAGIRLLMSRT